MPYDPFDMSYCPSLRPAADCWPGGRLTVCLVGPGCRDEAFWEEAPYLRMGDDWLKWLYDECEVLGLSPCG